MKQISLHKKHIVHIIPTLSRGGAERLVVDICNALDRRFFICSIITFNDDVPLAVQLHTDVMVHIIPKTKKIDIGFIRQLKKQLRSMKPDIVHTHLSGGDVWGSRAAASIGIPVVSTEHSLNSLETFLHNWLKKKSIKYIDTHIAISQAVKSDMSARYDISLKDITIIYNGVNIDIFQKILPVKNFSKKVKILLVGRLEKEKGHQQFLDALLQVKRGTYQVTIVGEGSCKQDLQLFVANNQLTSSVKFVGYHDEIQKVYAKHDIVVVPSRSEGFGLVAVEAMAAGRVVFASNIEGLTEVIDNKKNGFLVDFTDEYAFSNLLQSLRSTPELIIKITVQAKKDAQKFDLHNMVNEYEKVYTKLVISN